MYLTGTFAIKHIKIKIGRKTLAVPKSGWSKIIPMGRIRIKREKKNLLRWFSL